MEPLKKQIEIDSSLPAEAYHMAQMERVARNLRENSDLIGQISVELKALRRDIGHQETPEEKHEDLLFELNDIRAQLMDLRAETKRRDLVIFFVNLLISLNILGILIYLSAHLAASL